VLITAHLKNSASAHEVLVSTAGSAKPLSVPPKAGGQGSSVNGGEFLMLALATCYCNDLYREAARLKIPVDAVEVEASAEFDGIGLAATKIWYRARVSSPASAEEVAGLVRETDAVAKIHNTVRSGALVTLASWDTQR
jgi:organic hydroperoxide reductase OsmC/OhrA